MRLNLPIIVLFCFLLVVIPAAAQEATEPPPTPAQSAVSGEMQGMVTRVEEAAVRAEQAAEQAVTAIDLSFNLLNLFEILGAFLGLLIPALAIAAGFLGFRRLQALNERLDMALEEIGQRTKRLDDVHRLSEEVLEAKRQAEKATYRVEAIIDEGKSQTVKLRDELTSFVSDFDTGLASRYAELEEKMGEIINRFEDERRKVANANLAMSLMPLGERQYRSQDFSGAMETYHRALELDPTNLILYYRLGYVSTQSGLLEEAEQYLTRALEIEPDFAPALAALGYVYRRKGEKLEGLERNLTLNQAESYLLKALTISPRLVDDEGESWWGSLGGLYRRRGQINEAIHAYENAANAVPHSSYPFSNLALLYLQTNNREAMLRTYERVEQLAESELQFDPSNYWAWADLLTAQLARREMSAVKDTLNKVFNTVPTESPYVLEALIDTLERLAQASDEDTAAFIRKVIEEIRKFIASLNSDSPDIAE